MGLAVDDLMPLRNEVARFARDRLGPAVARPEVTLSSVQLGALSDEAATLGLLPRGDEATGAALWEEMASEANRAFSLAALASVAEVNAGVALHWHRQALTVWLSRRLGQTVPTGEGAVQLLGHFGLGRDAIGRYWRGVVTADDMALLADLYSTAARPVLLAPNWRWLWWPVWQENSLQWACLAVDQVRLLQAPGHGLDELLQGYLTPTMAPACSSLSPTTARELARELMQLEWLGLLAITQGALRHADTLARHYAGLRRQGGRCIAQHPAVQALLADVGQVETLLTLQLGGLARLPLGPALLSILLRVRGHLHEVALHAGNSALQVFGGIGYMRDCGIEKIVRDVHQLQLLAGTAPELAVVLAGWEGAA